MKNNLKQTVFDSGVTKDLNHKNLFDNENPKRPNDEGRVSSNDDGTELSPEIQGDDDSKATSMDENNNTHPEGNVPNETDFVNDFCENSEFNSKVEDLPAHTVRRSSRQTKLPTSVNDFVNEGKVKYGVEKVVNYANLNHGNFCFATWSLIKYEARLVAKGFNQRERIDFDETFSPVVKIYTVRCLIALYVTNKWPLSQLYVNNAFLYGDLDEDVYMTIPQGFANKDNKNKSKNNKFIALLVYVDDIVVTGNCMNEIENFKSFLKSKFNIKDLGSLKYFLGIEGCKPVSTPMEPNSVLPYVATSDDPLLDNITSYQKLLCKLIYLTHTRPDISYSVHCLAQYMHSSLKFHLNCALNVLRYLKNAPEAEYRFMSSAACEIIWIQKLLFDLKTEVTLPVDLFCDNKFALQLAINTVFHERQKEDFIPIVEQIWNENIQGCTMFKVVKRLKMLKGQLKKLSWKNGNIFDNVVILRDKVKDAQNAVNEMPYDNERKKIAATILNEYNEAMIDEENLLFQMAKVEWLNEGDRNTTYFHKAVKSKRNKNRIMSINNSQGIAVEGNDVATEVVNTLRNFFMVKEVSDKEIKNAMFDISDYKAPGPDGYSTCFFKKAWNVVGKDVCQAVKDFFVNGKLLKEINSTLIALIPKSAFIQGRTIQDNILLTQELLKGYNRKGGSKRCSLKIDIAKAYDTVSWEFLRSILTLFGFHKKMVDWICTCITSTSFSISINGEIHGNFKGGRGLRQGDPISHYLFTLVMEVFTLIMNYKIQQAHNFKYHVGCKDIKLTHLCFADDLLVLCYGSTESVIVIKEALELFSKIFGLKPNMNKSTIFFSNMDIGEKSRILNIMPFQVGTFPNRYLGVPLITKRLGKTECKKLVDKVKSRIGDWKNKFLSYAGRVQLIASVLSSMHIYWASVFLLPKSNVKDIERVLKGFLWNQGDIARVQWIHMVKLKEMSVWEIEEEANDSWTWKALLNLRSKARRHIEHKIGNGESTSVWFDKWCDNGPFCQLITNRGIYDARFDLKAFVADMIVNGQWIWNDERQNKFPNICSIRVPMLTNEKDSVVWKSKNGGNKKFSVKQVWNDYNKDNPTVKWGKLTCMDSHNPLFFQCPYSIRVWKVLKKKIKVYYIWQERNKRQFTNEKRTMKDVSGIILDTVRLKLSITDAPLVFCAISGNVGNWYSPLVERDIGCISLLSDIIRLSVKDSLSAKHRRAMKDSLSEKHQRAMKGLAECKASARNLRRIQVKDIVKEVEDYLKTYSSAGMDISWYVDGMR
ncbi:RNA-directed DNA polymerase, eukaryota, reverse transcriptase zinc-binding domain protein [Tanacetum coccineum]|uniref:RNA-directed DNA polymerase, eukaryota, reverse transcriptase zinc-binding domain protein n=1 Tax=Tanacetum coccineum TaxID=301880 RepID=A0ABQ5C3P2_9ASTR